MLFEQKKKKKEEELEGFSSENCREVYLSWLSKF